LPLADVNKFKGIKPSVEASHSVAKQTVSEISITLATSDLANQLVIMQKQAEIVQLDWKWYWYLGCHAGGLAGSPVLLDLVVIPVGQLGSEVHHKAHCCVGVKLSVALHGVMLGDESFHQIKAAERKIGPLQWQAHPFCTS
jgi:hypothetical protein